MSKCSVFKKWVKKKPCNLGDMQISRLDLVQHDWEDSQSSDPGLTINSIKKKKASFKLNIKIENVSLSLPLKVCAQSYTDLPLVYRQAHSKTLHLRPHKNTFKRKFLSLLFIRQTKSIINWSKNQTSSFFLFFNQKSANKTKTHKYI